MKSVVWFWLIADFDDVILAVCKRKIYKLKATECGRICGMGDGGSRKLMGVELNIPSLHIYSIDIMYFLYMYKGVFLMMT